MRHEVHSIQSTSNYLSKLLRIQGPKTLLSVDRPDCSGIHYLNVDIPPYPSKNPVYSSEKSALSSKGVY